jgi:hypothetical protein
MRKLALVAAAIGLLGALGAATPSLAATGQCFDAYGRPLGPPYNTDNPPYGTFCAAFRQGGSCTGVSPSWAESNCGYSPRRYYRDDGYRYRNRDYDGRRYNQDNYRQSPKRPGESEHDRAARDFKRHYSTPTWQPEFHKPLHQ